jgi:hypothetical protein
MTGGENVLAARAKPGSKKATLRRVAFLLDSLVETGGIEPPTF